MLEDLLHMLLRGFIIGIVVSAPMGPVGIFCIQRTLDKGRLSGFYTGVGAAISDLIYCFLTGFCLSFIEEFINTNRSVIQLFGASVLIAFGIWLIRKRPAGAVCQVDGHENASRETDILKGFALTFSNPLILFLIIGLFAQFNFVIEDMKFYHYILGFIGIFSGALGWWWVVTFFVDKLRSHFNNRTMKRINVCVGIIILVFAAVGIVGSMSAFASRPQKYPDSWLPERNRSGSSVVGFRVEDRVMKGWYAEVSDSLGAGFCLMVSPGSATDAFGDMDVDGLSLRVTDLFSGRELGSCLLTDGIDPYKGKNAWRLISDGGLWRLFAGNREYHPVMTFFNEIEDVADVVVEANEKCDVIVSCLDVEVKDVPMLMNTNTDVDDIMASVEDRDGGLSGIWSLFDHVHDDSYASVGGNYRLAVVPADDSGDYDMLYLSGARTLSSVWKAGMRKGILSPTPFSGVYDVTWIDAEENVMAHDIQADFDPLSGSLSISFPYQNTTLRFRKER